MGGRGAVPIAAAVWVGVQAGTALGALGLWAGLALVAPLAMVARGRPGGVAALVAILAFGAAGMMRGGSSGAALLRASRGVAETERPAWMRVAVEDHPWRESGEPVATVRVLEGGGAVPRGARMRVRLPAGADAEWGDQLEILVRPERPAPRRSPGGYPAREALAAQGIVAQGRALVSTRMGQGSTLARSTWVRWRRALERRYQEKLSASTREIVTPLVIGDRSGMGADLGAQLQAAGLTHLIALSGIHVTWMAAVARGVAALGGAGSATRALAGALCALLYVLLAGPIPSLVRAAAMEILAALARLRNRALDPVQALALTIIALLAVAPGWGSDLGFQLSCAATLGLITLGTRLGGPLARLPGALRAPLHPLVPTASAQVMALPLLLERFHSLPWTTLFANLLAIPVCELLLVAAWLAALVDAAAPDCARWLFGACEALASALRAIASAAAGTPLALIPTGHGPGIPWLAAAGAAALAWAASGPRDLEGARPGLAGTRFGVAWMGAIALALSLALAVSAAALRPPPGRWWLVALDVGQGDALALGFRDGWWLVDTGPGSPRFDAGARVVLPFLRWAGVRRLEGMVITHDHADHGGGAAAVLRGIPVARVVLPPEARVPEGARQVHRARRGDTLWRVPPVVVRWPAPGFRSRDPNVGSLVLEVGEGSGRALLAADVDSTVEESLAVAGPLAGLKVAHHGSRLSSGARFLARIRAEVAVISCGRRNPFGHADPGAVDRLRRSGAVVLRTDRDATIWLELGGATRRVEWETRSPPRRAERDPAPRRAAGGLAGPPARW